VEFTGIGYTLNLPQGPLLIASAYSIGKFVCPMIVPRYNSLLPFAQVPTGVDPVLSGLAGDVPVGRETMPLAVVGGRVELPFGYVAFVG
jgi:hypothetical protein